MSSSHFSHEQLRDYLQGRLALESADEVTRHLVSCAECERTVFDLEYQADALVSLLVEARPATDFVDEPDFQRAMAFVRRIRTDSDESPPRLGHPSFDGESVPHSNGADAPAPLRRLREYELLKKLGEGGMDAVYKARHVRLNKIVAVKILSGDRMNKPSAVARFEREMLAVGNLDHPNLIRAHDAGEVDGTHFLVMEYVAGCDLSAIAMRHGRLKVADACELVRQAAIGLQYAHEHGMVHRDIKPGNLMLTRSSASGTQSAADVPVVKVLDLGLALLRDQSASSGQGELTGSDQIMGTIDYMAPEQVDNSHAVDIRADLFSLGATLYKLLTGTAPFAVAKEEPLLKRLTALATLPHVPLTAHRREVPVALSALVDRLLAKQPRDRFATPIEVADALMPFAQGHGLAKLFEDGIDLPAPALAGTQSYLGVPHTDTLNDLQPHNAAKNERNGASKTGLRKRIALATAGCLIVSMAAWVMLRAPVSEVDRPLETVAAPGRLTSIVLAPSTPRTRSPSPLDELTRANIPKEELAAAGLGNVAEAPAQLVAVVGNSRWTQWGPIRAVAYGPDGNTLVTACDDDSIMFWDAATGYSSRPPLRIGSFPTTRLFFSPDKRILVSAAGGSTTLWDAATGSIKRSMLGVVHPAYSADGRYFAAYGRDSQFVTVWDTQTWQGVASVANKSRGQVNWLGLSSDGSLLATWEQGDRTLRLWDWATTKLRKSIWLDGGHAAVLADNRTLAAVDKNQVRLLDLETLEPRDFQGNLPDVCQAFAASPDGQWLAAATIRETGVTLMNVTSGKQRQLPLNGLGGSSASFDFRPQTLAFSQDSRTLAAAGGDLHSVQFWDVDASANRTNKSDEGDTLGNVVKAVVTPDGRTLVIGSADDTIQLWDLPNTQRRSKLYNARTSGMYTMPQSCFALSPDARTVVFVSHENDANGVSESLQICELSNGRPRQNFGVRRRAGILRAEEMYLQVSFLPDGREIVAAEGNRLHIWDLASARETATLEVENSKFIRDFAVSPRAKSVAVTTVPPQGTPPTLQGVQIWDLERKTRQATLTVDAAGGSFFAPVFSPDGKKLAAAYASFLSPQSHHVIQWDVATREVTATLIGHTRPITSASYSPDGRTLASSAQDGTVRLWDATTGELSKTIQLGPSSGRVSHVSFDATGRYLITTNGNGTVYVLRLEEYPSPAHLKEK